MKAKINKVICSISTERFDERRNKMTELMQMVIDKFGVKVGERFSTKKNCDAVFCFNKFGEMTLIEGPPFIAAIDSLLIDLLLENDEIVKIPFKPKYHEAYRFVNKRGDIEVDYWSNYDVHYYRFNAENCFRTEEEITEEDIERIVADMKSKYETE